MDRQSACGVPRGRGIEPNLKATGLTDWQGKRHGQARDGKLAARHIHLADVDGNVSGICDRKNLRNLFARNNAAEIDA